MGPAYWLAYVAGLAVFLAAAIAGAYSIYDAWRRPRR